jgi:predicted nucleotidyltransferase
VSVNIGDRAALAHEILRSEVGSGVHGMAIEGTDDRDEMGVFIETPSRVLGATAAEHYVFRTAENSGARSYAGDLDLTLYGLRKWTRLALSGNPTVLALLFAPESALVTRTDLGYELRALAPAFVSRHASHRFARYLDAQRERLTGGGKQNRVPNRPELIEKYGYDTKYASHALRLGLQGLELTRTGSVTLPMPPGDLGACMAIKTGEVTYEAALHLIDATATKLEQAIAKSSLPPEPDREAVGEWMVSAYRRHWKQRGLL